MVEAEQAASVVADPKVVVARGQPGRLDHVGPVGGVEGDRGGMGGIDAGRRQDSPQAPAERALAIVFGIERGRGYVDRGPTLDFDVERRWRLRAL